MDVFEIYNEKEVKRLRLFVNALQALICELWDMMRYIPREKLVKGFYSFDLCIYQKEALDLFFEDGYVKVTFYDSHMEVCKIPLDKGVFQEMEKFLKDFFPLIKFDDLITLDLEKGQISLAFCTGTEEKAKNEPIFSQFVEIVKDLAPRVRVSRNTDVAHGVLFLEYEV